MPKRGPDRRETSCPPAGQVTSPSLRYTRFMADEKDPMPNPSAEGEFLTTESGEPITTESGEKILLEEPKSSP
jgi:hypothetical protein